MALMAEVRMPVIHWDYRNSIPGCPLDTSCKGIGNSLF